MIKKIAIPPKGGDPEQQPVRRPDQEKAPPLPDDRKHPCRDTRETPAPNPNGESGEGATESRRLFAAQTCRARQDFLLVIFEPSRHSKVFSTVPNNRRKRRWIGTALKEIGSSSKIKEQWGKLSDDDLDRVVGKRDQLESTIQERYGIEKDRVHADVDDWCNPQKWN